MGDRGDSSSRRSYTCKPLSLTSPAIVGRPRVLHLGAVYDNRRMAAEHLRRLLPFAGIGASFLAVNGLAAGPGSPAVAFYLFALLFILHVLRV
jgi:hypothetical protein